MKKETKNNWILIPNSIFPNINNENFLTPDEAYLFSLLYRWRIIYDNMAVFNIDGIHELSDYKFMNVKPNGDATRNKTKIKNILSSLVEKEYIYIAEPVKNKKNNELLFIQFYEIKHYHQITKGHNQNITYDLFDQFSNPLEFYIYAYIDCFGEEGRIVSYKQWEQITGVKHDKIEKIIEKMNSYKYHPRIWKFSGDYYHNEYGEIRQNENTYFTRPSEDIIDQWNRYYAQSNPEEWELAMNYKERYKKENMDTWGEYPFH